MAETSMPSFSEQVCFDLYAASRAVVNAYRPVLTELGLTYPQYLVMLLLWERGTCTVKEMVELLQLDHGTLTPLLRRMEKGGFVTRRRAEGDERFVVVTLTPHGESLRENALKIHCDMKQAMGLGDEGLRALQATLRVLTGNVTE